MSRADTGRTTRPGWSGTPPGRPGSPAPRPRPPAILANRASSSTISLANVHSVGPPPSAALFAPSPGTCLTRSGLGTRRRDRQHLRSRLHAASSVPGSMVSSTLTASAPTVPPTSCAHRSPAGLAYGLRLSTCVMSPESPEKEHHDGLLAVSALDRLLQVVDVIGRDPAGVGRGVAGEVDDAAEQFAACRPRRRSRRPPDRPARRLDDVGIALAGMRDGQAVLHPEAAIERHRGPRCPLPTPQRGAARRWSAWHTAATICLLAPGPDTSASAHVDFS